MYLFIALPGPFATDPSPPRREGCKHPSSNWNGIGTRTGPAAPGKGTDGTGWLPLLLPAEGWLTVVWGGLFY